MISVELLSYIVKRQIEQLAAKIYAYLTCIDDIARSFFTNELGMTDLVEVLDFLLYIRDCEPLRRTAGEVVLKQIPYVGEADIGLVEERHLVDDFGHGAFQLPDIGTGAFGDVKLDVFGDAQLANSLVDPVFFDETLHDAELRFDFGGLDVERTA